jgi:hypothetical protein
VERKYPGIGTYGMGNLQIQWLEKDTVFTIEEDDGYEKICVIAYDVLVA